MNKHHQQSNIYSEVVDRRVLCQLVNVSICLMSISQICPWRSDISWGPWPFDPLMAFASMVPRTNLAIEPLQKESMKSQSNKDSITQFEKDDTLPSGSPKTMSCKLPARCFSWTSSLHADLRLPQAQPVPKPTFLQCTNLQGAGQRMGRSTSFSPCQQFVTFKSWKLHGTRHISISTQNPTTIASLMLFFFMVTTYTYSHSVN